MKDHLVERFGAQERPAGLQLWRSEKEDGEGFSGSGKAAMRIIGRRRRMADGAERADVGQVARREGVAEGEADVLGLEGAPDGVVERVRRGH